MSKSIRIIIGGLGLGGAERHLSVTLPELVKYGWKIKIITLSDADDLKDIFVKNNIEVSIPPGFFGRIRRNNKFLFIFCRALRLFVNFIRLYFDFIKDRKSITHFYLPEAYIFGTLTALLAVNRAPMVMSRRSLNYYQKKRPLLGKVERNLHRFMDLVITNSKANKKQLIAEGVTEEKIKLLYNGIPGDINLASKTELRKKHAIAKDGFVMTIVANLIPYKGHADLINALALIKGQLPKNWQLLCVGRDDGIQQNLEGLAKEKNVADNIKFLGQQNNSAEFFALADIAISASHEEGFSNSVIEAMLAGLPLVVTNVGGNPEAVIDGENGFVVAARDEKAMAEAILKLANDEDLRLKFSSENKKRVEENFTLAVCVENYNKIYGGL